MFLLFPNFVIVVSTTCQPISFVSLHLYLRLKFSSYPLNPLTASHSLPNYPSRTKTVNTVTWVKR